jgi:hypothetical protein
MPPCFDYATLISRWQDDYAAIRFSPPLRAAIDFSRHIFFYRLRRQLRHAAYYFSILFSPRRQLLLIISIRCHA